MSPWATMIRDRIESSELPAARQIVTRVIRRAARKRIYEYAARKYITDFHHPILVPQRHRDFRDQVVAQATTLAAEAQAASGVPELLAIFDQVAPHL